jgi:predicted nucleic acid-binding Zn ribbon protein
LDGLLGDRLWQAGLAVGELARRWDDVVGERLAEESRPAALDGGILFVKATSAAWATQIGFLAEQVATRANEVMGRAVVVAVKVAVESGPPAGPGSVGPRR